MTFWYVIKINIELWNFERGFKSEHSMRKTNRYIHLDIATSTNTSMKVDVHTFAKTGHVISNN